MNNIGRLLIIEFADNESQVFDKIIEVLETHTEFEGYGTQKESKIILPGLEIYLDRRKVYCNAQKVDLTAKEYELLYLLVVHKEQTLTYSQIYERVWKEDTVINEKKAIGFHIRNLREKLYKASPQILFTIRSVREVGYCLEVN